MESCYMKMDSPRVIINDSVHGVIYLPKVCLDVIDTQEFQRLRALKQCGICNFIYPSATHSRFEHSIGVCHWAREFLRHCDASVSNDKKLCVLLAGLCHDLGHGPFSHVWERFLEKRGISWKHAANSAEMFKYLVAENNLEPVFRNYGLESEHVDFICHLIVSNAPIDEKDFFLYEIIDNKDNGLDVDKFEYIMRDTKQFGMSFDLDIHRIINCVGIVEQNGVKYIGFRDKIADCLMDVFVCRAKLHRRCYQHHTCKAVEAMLIDALLAADDHFRISWEENSSTGDGVDISIGQDSSERDPLSKVKFFTKHSPSVPISVSSDDIKSASFIKENYHFEELLIFCTKGKKSMSPEELDVLKTQAKSMFEELLAATVRRQER